MHLKPVGQYDLWDVSRTLALSNWNDEISGFIAPFKEQYPDSWYHNILLRMRIRYYRGEELFLVVTDEQDFDWTGKSQVMGYCCYSHNLSTLKKPSPGGWLGNFFERKALALEETYASWLRLDRSADHQAMLRVRELFDVCDWNTYFDSLPADVKQRVNGRHFELENLGTHPDFRRRGVAKLMLEEGFKRAREHQLPLVVLSSTVGEKLYLSQGFKEIRRVNFSAEDMKNERIASLSESEHGWALMVWEPEGFGH